MLFTLEVCVGLYLVSFVWFWSLCRSWARRAIQVSRYQQTSKIIPFEKGMRSRMNQGSSPGF